MNMYAIGKRKSGGDGESFAMWYGPHPSEREMLEQTGTGFDDFIIKFMGDPRAGEEVSHKISWNWNAISGEWTRYNPRVLNKKNDARFITQLRGEVVYIGRGSKWGNPFAIGKDGSREEVITKYMERLVESPQLLEAIPELTGKFLSCYCAPEACHGDILIDMANPIDEGGVDKWRFTKYIPDPEDFEVKARECERYLEKMRETGYSGSDIDVFNAGFTRGTSWGIHKITRTSDHLTGLQYKLYKGDTKIVDDGYEDDIPF